jgi:hypothetical protein
VAGQKMLTLLGQPARATEPTTTNSASAPGVRRPGLAQFGDGTDGSPAPPAEDFPGTYRDP